MSRPINHGDRPALVCLGYAGGSSAIFRGWDDRLGDLADVHAVDLPGRGHSEATTPATSMEEAVEHVVRTVTALGDVPVAWFGHSMGAIVAYEAATRLDEVGRTPLWFFASGCAAPHQFWQRVVPLDDDSLVAAAVRWARHDDRPGPETIRPYLANLRADIRLCEGYVWSPHRPFDVPLTAFTGTLDEVAPRSAVQAWARVTRRSLLLQQIIGGHFFIRTPRGVDIVCDTIRRDLEHALASTQDPHREAVS